MTAFFENLIPPWVHEFIGTFNQLIELWPALLAAVLVGMLLGAWLGRWVAVLVVAIIAATFVYLRSGGSTRAVEAERQRLALEKERDRRIEQKRQATKDLTWIERIRLGL